MKIYKYYITLGSKHAALMFCEEKPDLKRLIPYYLAFYKERGGYAEMIMAPEFEGRYFRYHGPMDVFDLVSLDRDIDCLCGKMDLICWKDKDRDKHKWSLGEYLGLASKVAANMYRLPGSEKK